MKILYLINQISKTSVPIQWSKTFNNLYSSKDIQIVSIKKFNFNSLKTIFQSKIIHGHHIKAMSIFLFFNLIFRKKTVYTVHGSYLYLSKQNKFLLKYIFKKAHKVIFVNQYLYDVLPENFKNILQNKYEVILNGVDLDFDYVKEDVYNKFNIDKENFIIFHPARFVKEKNHIKFLEAFKLFKKDVKNAKLVLAGDGALREEIESKIDELELKEDVVLLGLISKNDVYNFLSKCDLFIMPSISEGLNIAFLEAISMNRKVLVSDIEQFTYPFKHYKKNPDSYNVYFTNPNHSVEIYNTLIQIKDLPLHNEFDINNFSLKNMFNEYKKIYNELAV